MKRIFTLLSGLLLGGSVWAQSSWSIDRTHSKISFTVTHMMVSEVEGELKDFDARVSTTSDDFDGATVEFTAQVSSISTDNDRRDDHLRSDDFFSASTYPTLVFKGKLVRTNGEYALQGNLTIREVTRAVTFPVVYGGMVDTNNGKKAGFKVTGSINREDYGLKWNYLMDGGGTVVSDEVGIICRIELNKAA